MAVREPNDESREELNHTQLRVPGLPEGEWIAFAPSTALLWIDEEHAARVDADRAEALARATAGRCPVCGSGEVVTDDGWTHCHTCDADGGGRLLWGKPVYEFQLRVVDGVEAVVYRGV